MPELTIENHDIHETIVSDPDGTFYMNVPAGEEVTEEVTDEELENMREQLAELDMRELDNGDPAATISLSGESPCYDYTEEE